METWNYAETPDPVRFLAGIIEEEVDVLDGGGDEELVGVLLLVDLLDAALLERDDEMRDVEMAEVELRVDEDVAEQEELGFMERWRRNRVLFVDSLVRDLRERVVVDVFAVFARRDRAGHEQLHLVFDLHRADRRLEELAQRGDELAHVDHARDALRLLVAHDVQVAVHFVQRFVAEDFAQRRRRATQDVDERLLGELHLERPARHEAEPQRIEGVAEEERAQMSLDQHVVEVDVEFQPEAAEQRAHDVGRAAVIEALRGEAVLLEQRHVRLHGLEEHLVVLLLRRELDHHVLLVRELIGHFDLVVHDRPVQVRQHGLDVTHPRFVHRAYAVEIVAVVHSAIVLNEIVERHFGAHVRIMRVAVQHNRRVRQHVDAVLVPEHVRIVFVVALRERLHQPVDLLRFSGQSARHPLRPQPTGSPAA